jgi:CheY-like chemotaxis protein
MGGVIDAESIVGKGSTFWFELVTVAKPQLVSEVEEETVAPPPLLGDQEKYLRTLLYVEDNPANMKLVVQIIQRHPGIRLLTAEDGYKGIEIAREFLPDVILMDINLPGINGFEALKILRSDPATAQIPVIALSANAMPRDIENGLKAGFFHYMTKPIMVNEFMASLKVALEFSKSGGS